MIVNLQRKVKIDARGFMPFLIAVRAAVEEVRCCHFSVALVSDKRMQELNSMFRGKDSTTDVLSFPHEKDEFENVHHTFAPDDITPEEPHDFLGDIVISAEQAERQAQANGLSLECEIKQLILHGVLHLCGFDHETDNGEMNTRELELRSKLGIEA
jgi:probable rRNA maturation factor